MKKRAEKTRRSQPATLVRHSLRGDIVEKSLFWSVQFNHWIRKVIIRLKLAEAGSASGSSPHKGRDVRYRPFEEILIMPCILTIDDDDLLLKLTAYALAN